MAPNWKKRKSQELAAIEGEIASIHKILEGDNLSPAQLEDLKALEKKKGEWLFKEEQFGD
jgi:hypothetical protein